MEMISSRLLLCRAFCVAIIAAFCVIVGLLSYQRFDTWLEHKMVHQAAEDLILVLTPNSVIDTYQEPRRMQDFCRKVQLANLRISILEQLDATLASGSLSAAHHAALQRYVTKANAFFGAIDAALSEQDLQRIAANIGDTAQALGVSSGRAGKIKSWFNSVLGYGQKLINRYAHKNPCHDKPEGKLSLVDRVVAHKMVASIVVQSKPDAECSEAERAEKQAMRDVQDAIAQKIKEKMHDQGKNVLVKQLLPYALLFTAAVPA